MGHSAFERENELYVRTVESELKPHAAETRTPDAAAILQREQRHELPTAQSSCKSFERAGNQWYHNPDASHTQPPGNRMHVHGSRCVRHLFHRNRVWLASQLRRALAAVAAADSLLVMLRHWFSDRSAYG